MAGRRGRIFLLSGAQLLSVASLTHWAEAADDARQGLGIGLNLSLVQLREDLIAPVRFTGPGFGLSSSYHYELGGFSGHARLRLALAPLFDRYGSLNYGAFPRLDLAAFYQVVQGAGFTLQVGAELGFFEQLLFAHAWDDAHAYWLGAVAMGPALRMMLPVQERTLAFEVTAPVLALVSRPSLYREYKADPLVNLGFWFNRFADSAEWTSLDRLQALRLRATFQSRNQRFHVAPWSEFELNAFQGPRLFLSMALWLGAEALFGL